MRKQAPLPLFQVGDALFESREYYKNDILFTKPIIRHFGWNADSVYPEAEVTYTRVFFTHLIVNKSQVKAPPYRPVLDMTPGR